MPPEGERLSKEQIGLLRAWIDQGASWPEGNVSSADSTLGGKVQSLGFSADEAPEGLHKFERPPGFATPLTASSSSDLKRNASPHHPKPIGPR